MLRRHNVTLEYEKEQDNYVLNIDGNIIYLTHEDMNKLSNYLSEKDDNSSAEITKFLREQYGNLYNLELPPILDAQTVQDVIDVLHCQFSGHICTQEPER